MLRRSLIAAAPLVLCAPWVRARPFQMASGLNLGLPAIATIGIGSGSMFPTFAAWQAEWPNPIPIAKYANGITGQFDAAQEHTFNSTIVFGGYDTTQYNGTGIPAVTLTAIPGQNFNRTPGPLAYNPANGAALNFDINPGISPYNNGIVVASDNQSSNIKISNLQLKLTNGNSLCSLDNNYAHGVITIDSCICYDYVGSLPFVSGTVTVCINSLIFALGAQIQGEFVACPHGCVFDGPSGVGGHFYYCTIVAPSDLTPGLADNGVTNTAGDTQGCFAGNQTFMVNCGVFGFRVASSLQGPGTSCPQIDWVNCATDSPKTASGINCLQSGTIDQGTGILTSLVYGRQFHGNTSTSPDFRALSTGNLVGAGVPVTANLLGTGIPGKAITVDVFGNQRSATATTIGCHEP